MSVVRWRWSRVLWGWFRKPTAFFKFTRIIFDKNVSCLGKYHVFPFRLPLFCISRPRFTADWLFTEVAGAMASFRIHDDQENASLGLRKDNADVFSAAQRRALGDLSQFACNQKRNIKLVSVSPCPFRLFAILFRICQHFRVVFSRDWRMDLVKFKMRIGRCDR